MFNCRMLSLWLRLITHKLQHLNYPISIYLCTATWLCDFTDLLTSCFLGTGSCLSPTLPFPSLYLCLVFQPSLILPAYRTSQLLLSTSESSRNSQYTDGLSPSSFLLIPCGSEGTNLGCQAWWPVPSPTKPPHRLRKRSYWQVNFMLLLSRDGRIFQKM